MAKNQTAAIREHLASGKSITSMEAFTLYGCTRLSAKIHDMKKSGFNIVGIDVHSMNRYGRVCTYKKYSLTKQPDL